ncbi:hypothetical protein PILCRDRAFT_82276 [Piloderma croceum F 1598]|uniref:Uncharacterized protein n=1 Tax=Piloderma croceum (strain F 1598) TaxID=765440 RepID=A0A0C3B3Z5_PILCF|nr:hypothetical protein PILCRDRAFT_82276 [Piloderma croceum F 1598]
MINKLSDLIKLFPGGANCVWCFNHIIALVAKSAICQFDVPKGQADAALNEAERELRDLAEGIDIEDEMMQGEWEIPGDDDNEENGDGWVDEVAALSIADHEELEVNVRPIRLVLVKLHKVAFAILHSTTLLLPLWF